VDSRVFFLAFVDFPFSLLIYAKHHLLLKEAAGMVDAENGVGEVKPSASFKEI